MVGALFWVECRQCVSVAYGAAAAEPSCAADCIVQPRESLLLCKRELGGDLWMDVDEGGALIRNPKAESHVSR